MYETSTTRVRVWMFVVPCSRNNNCYPGTCVSNTCQCPSGFTGSNCLTSKLCYVQQQVAQLWQRDRASSINDFRWGSIWGYYRLRSYFSRHCDTTQFTLTHHMVNKPFLLLGLAAEYRSRHRRRRCANNIATDHQMFITLAGQLSWQRLRRSAVDLHSKTKKSLFEPPFRALRGNVRTPSMACWKARGRLYIRRNWTFFAISYCWAEIGRSRRFSKGVGHFERRFQREASVAHQPLLVSE